MYNKSYHRFRTYRYLRITKPCTFGETMGSFGCQAYTGSLRRTPPSLRRPPKFIMIITQSFFFFFQSNVNSEQ